MKKDEADFRRKFIVALTEWSFHVQHQEDRIYTGIPDLSWARSGTDGWFELKYSPKRPVKAFSPPDFTDDQRRWLKARGAAGSGHCYLVWAWPQEVYILNWTWFDAVLDASLKDPNKLGWNNVPGRAWVLGGAAEAAKWLSNYIRQR